MAEEKNQSQDLIRHINEVTNFNPDQLCQIIADANGEPKGSHLPVRAQKGWFRLKHPEGKVAVEPVKIDYDAKFAVFRARVYANKTDAPDAFLSEAFAIRAYDPAKPDVSFIEWAQTAAIGRALTDAGYGLQYDHSGEVPDYLLNDAQSGAGQSPAGKQPTNSNSAAQNTAAQPPVGAAQNNRQQNGQPAARQSQQGQQPQNRQSAPQSQQPSGNGQSRPQGQSNAGQQPSSQNQPANKLPADPGLTYERAVTIAVTFGDNKGKTLGEIAKTAPADLEWLATKYGGNNLLKQAAKLIWDKAQQNAA